MALLVSSYMANPRSYRKVYEQHYGPIPKDSNGRSYEIHHIDGNHNNYDISNLKLVTIEEHYAIHYAQGDWAACAIISKRAKIPPEEVSRLVSLAAKARVEAGTHHWVGPTHNQDMVDSGIHPFLDGEAARQRNLKRVKAGTHNLLKRDDGSSQSGDRVKAGTHHFVKNNPVKNLLASGTHASKIKLSCVFCRKQCSKNNFNKEHKQCGPENFTVTE